MEATHQGAATVDHYEAGTLHTMYALEAAMRRYPSLHLRYSEGPTADASSAVIDVESALELPGLGASPLTPEDWWLRPITDWLARQIWRLRRTPATGQKRFIWALTGRASGRGPNCEPLLANIVPVARLSDELLSEAEERYRKYFEADTSPKTNT